MEEWKEYKLSDLSDFIAGFAFKSADFGSTGFPVVKIKDIQPPSVNVNGMDKVDLSPYNINKLEKFLIFKEDFVMAMTGATIGKIGRYINEEPAYLNQRVLKFIPKDQVDAKYIYYSLLTKRFRSYINNHIDSESAQPNISANTIGKYELKVPNIQMQRKISCILKSLDDKIELNHRINENLEQQAQALFKSWFVDFEPFKDGKFVESKLGRTPEELTISRIGNIPHIIESGKRPKGGAVLKGVPSIGAENIKGLGYYDYSKTKYIPKDFALKTNRGKINGYELLIYKDGGKPGYFIPSYTIFGEGFPFDEMFINEHVFRLNLMSKEYNIFAYFYMQTPYIMNQLNSIGGKAAIPGINMKDVESLPIFTGDNKKIKEFGNLVLPMITTILRNCSENTRLAQLRDTLLPRLVSGELTISDVRKKPLL